MRWNKDEKTAERKKTTLTASDVQNDPALLRWGTVSTIKAPIEHIARFIAYHLEAGAHRMDIFLDVPDASIAQKLAHPSVHFHQCDDAYWSGKPDKARETHQLRQAFNATRTYRRSRLDWLAHIDVDEFILTDTPLSTSLASLSETTAYARLHPVELLASEDWENSTAYFKRTRKHAGRRKSDLSTIYPTFGAYVPEGFISYSGGKNIVRTGFDNIRLGIHAMMQSGLKVSNGTALETAHIGHAHAPDWETFQHHFDFRMKHGSYRKKTNGNMILNDVLQVLLDQVGPVALRRFFNEMCTATPKRLDLLRAHDMLLEAQLGLGAKVAKHFGSLER